MVISMVVKIVIQNVRSYESRIFFILFNLTSLKTRDLQVVTNNATNYKVIGQMLMTKRKRLLWTLCATHCVDLMLEDYEKKILIHEDTIPKGQKITIFICSRSSLISLQQRFTKGRDMIRSGVSLHRT